MNEVVRLYVQLIANIVGVGFVIIMGTLQLVDYVGDCKVRHFFAAGAWFVLAPVLVLRVFGILKPPWISQQMVADGAAIGWALCLLLGMCWGLSKLWERRQQHKARQRIIAEVEKESNGDA